MNVLVVGGGGREHALALQLAQSRDDIHLLATPGNPGMTSVAECAGDVASGGVPAIVAFAWEREVDLMVVGPEAYLAMGLAGEARERGIAVFGPGRDGARLESSKVFAKNFMAKYGVPTGRFETFDDARRARLYLADSAREFPVVIKADGLAAGKGVIIAKTRDEAISAVETMMEKRIFGSAGDSIVIEEFLRGPELSVMALVCDGEFMLLPAARDHKRAFDGDEGPNTGGMGAYSPVPSVAPSLFDEIREKIFRPVMNGLASEGINYRGCLYAGLILTEDGPKVLEFNCRFGDPETQAVLPLLEGDFAGLLVSIATGEMDPDLVKVKDMFAVCVVAASKGYPGQYETGFEIHGLDSSGMVILKTDDPAVKNAISRDERIYTFHAGTFMKDGKFYTSGGRVVGVTGVALSMGRARELAYAGIKSIDFAGMRYRKDIAMSAALS
ncbi:MAG: phosphoribosylamine--glycine ligase [Firmicutes bacterium]|nr:phosphoribosylamine--glycine ligase [Bacillota bacterium]